MTKLLILALDRTVREPLSGQNFIQHPQDQMIRKGVEEAIAHYHSEEYCIVGIANQAGIASNYQSFAECFEVQRYTLNLIPEMYQICFCPDFEGRECWVVNQVSPIPISAASFGYEGSEFDPSGPGMLKFVMWQYNAVPQDCFYVGDRQEDASAADTAGVHFFWSETWIKRWNSLEYKTKL